MFPFSASSLQARYFLSILVKYKQELHIMFSAVYMSLNSKEPISKQHFTCQNDMDDLSMFIDFAKLEQLFVKIRF